MNRTAVALALTLLAVAVPCVAWYVAGDREARFEARAIERRELLEARAMTARMADRLGSRLEALRESESSRPFYHYQSLYHDPRGASEGPFVAPSPLSAGPGDSLIRAHFQIDAQGRLTMPTLNEEVCDLNAPESVVTQQPILQELEAPARSWWHGLQARLASQPQGAPAVQAQAPSRVANKLEVLESAAWTQNVQASKLYQDLRSRDPRQKAIPPPEPERPSERPANVVVEVGDFQWRTVPIGGVPALVALREVATPEGVMMQGFQIATAAVEQSLGATPAVRFAPGVAEGELHVAMPLMGQPWHLALPAMAPSPAARGEAASVVRRFRRLFFGGAAIASAAGILVVALVWQSEALARQRSRFAASAAHELRTPLAGMRMYGEMLAEGLGDPSRTRDYARRIADESERLGRVVTNVLGFTRLERDGLPVKPEPGDLAASIAEWVARMRPGLESLGAKVELALAPGLGPIRFDRDALYQILQNLLDNAEKYTRGASDRTIRVAVVPSALGATLEVADRGPGVAPAARRKLFQPFARGASADSPVGLGLGLVLVRALAQAQGARVAYREAPGGGASFVVELPASAGTEPMPSPAV